MGQEVLDIMEFDKAMYELEERLKADKEFSETFHRELEEIKQIQIPLEDERTE